MNYLWANSTQAFGSFGPLKSGYRGFFHFSEMLYTHKMHTPSLSQHIISSFKLLSVSTHTHTHTHAHTHAHAHTHMKEKTPPHEPLVWVWKRIERGLYSVCKVTTGEPLPPKNKAFQKAQKNL